MKNDDNFLVGFNVKKELGNGTLALQLLMHLSRSGSTMVAGC